MTRIAVSVIIKRPIDEVFAYTTDYSKLTEWEKAQLACSGPASSLCLVTIL
jgi:uncharacterized protein YndB with AHSA1/START domain